jgi:hypothetical protein
MVVNVLGRIANAVSWKLGAQSAVDDASDVLLSDVGLPCNLRRYAFGPLLNRHFCPGADS